MTDLENAGVFGNIDFSEVDTKDRQWLAKHADDDHRQESSQALQAALGMEMAQGGVLGPLAAALPFLENSEGHDHTKFRHTKEFESYIVGATTSDKLHGLEVGEDLFTRRRLYTKDEPADSVNCFKAENGEWFRVHFNGEESSTFADVFSARGVDASLNEDPTPDLGHETYNGIYRENGSVVARTTSDHYFHPMTPDSAEWGSHLAERYLPQIRQELGLASFSIDTVKPILEQIIEDETFLFEVNAAIGCGIFNGLKATSRMDLVEPLPSALEGAPGDYYRHMVVGLTQEEYDALANETENEDAGITMLDDAVVAVVGDMNNIIAASIADELGDGDPWGSTTSLTLQHKEALELVTAVADLCPKLLPARLRQALRDLADNPEAWEHFESLSAQDREPLWRRFPQAE